MAIDPDNGEILASTQTGTKDGDAPLVGPRLDQIAAPITATFADGAYDGDPIYQAVAEGASQGCGIIPPRTTAPSRRAATRTVRPPSSTLSTL